MAKAKKNYPIIKRPPGRPRKDISPAVQQIIITLIASGDSDNAVRKITGVQPREWQRLADEDEGFAKVYRGAIESRNGGLAAALRLTMLKMIGQGHPWWAKLAIHNYKTLLKDPDVKAAVKIKQQAEIITSADEDDEPERKQVRVRRIVKNDPGTG